MDWMDDELAQMSDESLGNLIGNPERVKEINRLARNERDKRKNATWMNSAYRTSKATLDVGWRQKQSTTQ